MAKLSTYPVATAVDNSDIVFGLVDGADEQIPRPLLFVHQPGESCVISAGGTTVTIDSSGNVLIDLPAGPSFGVRLNGTVMLGADATPLSFLATPAGGSVGLFANGAQLLIDGVGQIQIVPQFGQVVQCGYTPANPGDWVVAPTDLLLAVDRIARVVSNLGAIPIP